MEPRPCDCKFCGSGNVSIADDSEQYENPSYWVSCESCGAAGPVGYTQEHAIRLWGMAAMTKPGGD